MRLPLLACLLCVVLPGVESWTVGNPTGTDWQAEPLRVPHVLDEAPALAVAGRVLPQQWVEGGEGRVRWVAVDLPADGSITLEPHAGPAPAEPLVALREVEGAWELDNGLCAVRVPRGAAAAPPPISNLRGATGPWFGGGSWCAGPVPLSCTATVLGDGAVFAAIRLRYAFPDGGAVTIDVALEPGRRHVTITEHAEGCGAAAWQIDLTRGWAATSCRIEPYGLGFAKHREWIEEMQRRGRTVSFPPTTVTPGSTRMGDILIQLLPRWSQAYDDGWLFTCGDGERSVGAMPARAGRWLWPHEHRIAAVATAEGQAALRLPLDTGARHWFLLLGSEGDFAAKAAKGYAFRHAFLPLDKLVHEFITEWPEGLYVDPKKKDKPGKPPRFGMRDIWDDGSINPTGHLRSVARNAVKDAGKPGSFQLLTHGQWMLHPDTYGSYLLGWSPENPNFFSDLIKLGIAELSRLKDHPRFPELRAMAEMRLREDLEHSVTLPGGAGQECPGYLAHALHQWEELAPLCVEHFAFDPRAWPQFREAHVFLAKLGQPAGPARLFHPGGDTHPGKPDPVEMAAEQGIEVDVGTLVSEELPGFGALLRHRPGTGRETYVAFKAGPNRGHYHGDQLSIHACFDAWPAAVDHHCSYGPRAGQEHMHNRLALRGAGFADANMDGYERLLAFVTDPVADCTVGEVRSDRLRWVRPLPSELWDWRWEAVAFAEELIYRRSVVLLKGDRDVLVLRDQYRGPELEAIWCLHALGARCEQDGAWFHTEPLSVFVAKGADAALERRDWEHENGGREATVGLRLVQSGTEVEFITVLVPRPVATGTLLRLDLPAALRRLPAKGEAKEPPPPIDAELRLWQDQTGAITEARLASPLWNGGRPVALAATAAGWSVTAEIPGGRRAGGGPLQLQIELSAPEPDATELSGRFSGSFAGIPVQGELSGERQDDAPLSSPQYDTAWTPPPLAAIPGGVRIGETEVVFAGGIDDAEAAWVTVRRAGAVVTAIDRLDPERSQGEVGLFVPDAGYPFGRIPVWLKAQRAGRIGTTPTWPLSGP